MKVIPKRRRLENKTNYSKRMKILEGRKPRIVIRKSNKYITLQYIESKAAQDAVKVSVTSKELLDYGWPKEKEGSLKSLGAAYLAGVLFGVKIKKLAPAILDSGLIRSTKGSKIYSAMKGINDAGFKAPCKEEVYPTEDRIKNENISSFFDKVKLNVSKENK
jgi:large subunit ribosomal protein L18